MKWLELKIPPPLVTLLCAWLMWWLARWQGAAAQGLTAADRPMATLLAGILVVAGISIALTGALSFRRARTTIHPHRPEHSSALVTAGVYRWTRNPMYLGMLLVLLGWCLHLGSALALLGPVCLVIYLTRFQIVPEERALQALFGATYQHYLARVRRWL